MKKKFIKFLLISQFLLSILLLNACSSQKNTDSSKQESNNAANVISTADTSVSDASTTNPTPPMFDIKTDDFVQKLLDSSNYEKDETNSNRTYLTYKYHKGNVEVGLSLSKDGTEFTALSIIDSDSKAGIYKDVYRELMTFLGNDASDASILDSVDTNQVQDGNFWIKCYSDTSEKTFIITTYHE